MRHIKSVLSLLLCRTQSNNAGSLEEKNYYYFLFNLETFSVYWGNESYLSFFLSCICNQRSRDSFGTWMQLIYCMVSAKFILTAAPSSQWQEQQFFEVITLNTCWLTYFMVSQTAQTRLAVQQLIWINYRFCVTVIGATLVVWKGSLNQRNKTLKTSYCNYEDLSMQPCWESHRIKV